jgi:hypothetical protein
MLLDVCISLHPYREGCMIYEHLTTFHIVALWNTNISQPSGEECYDIRASNNIPGEECYDIRASNNLTYSVEPPWGRLLDYRIS